MLNIIKFIQENRFMLNNLDNDYLQLINKYRDNIENNIMELFYKNHKELYNKSEIIYKYIYDIKKILSDGYLLISEKKDNSLYFCDTVGLFLKKKELVKDYYTSFLELYIDLIELYKYLKVNRDCLEDLYNITNQYKSDNKYYMLIDKNFIFRFKDKVIQKIYNYIYNDITYFNNNEKFKILLKECCKEMQYINTLELSI